MEKAATSEMQCYVLMCDYCAVPGNIHTSTSPTEGQWNFQEGEGWQKKCFKKRMKLNWNFLGGGGVQTKKPLCRGVCGYIQRM